MDIYSIGAFFFLVDSFLYFKKSILIRSSGYRTIGMGFFVCAIALIIMRLEIVSVSYVLLIIGFIVTQVGFGIIMTKEKRIIDSLRNNTKWYQRVLGIIPKEAIQNIMRKKDERGTGVEKVDVKGSFFVGLFSIAAGTLILFWRKEVGYPVLLIVSGIIFISMSKIYGRK